MLTLVTTEHMFNFHIRYYHVKHRKKSKTLRPLIETFDNS